MITGITFFSYSRVNSVFALRLANSLRDAGFDIWIDQLDIRPGSHWDSSIEAALNASHNILLILSSSSVASNNVMDEVSFALEQGKRVIPVLFEQCKPTFRLRRLQQIDFTGDYDKALTLLKKELSSISPDNRKETEKEELEKSKNIQLSGDQALVVDNKKQKEKSEDITEKKEILKGKEIVDSPIKSEFLSKRPSDTTIAILTIAMIIAFFLVLLFIHSYI